MPCTPGVIAFRNWWGSRDKDGHREYHVVHRLRVDNTVGLNDGPANALNFAFLPLPGALWNFGGDSDVEAVCQWIAEMRPVIEDGERSEFFDVEQVFSTRPNDKCINRSGTGTGTGNPATDPLNEPPILSGSFVKYTEEKTVDRNGDDIVNSAWERVRGPLVEFDASRLTVRIQKNESTLDLASKALIIDNVNDSTMWGFAARTVKLSNITWEQKYSGDCVCYYQISYEFEIAPEGFDRTALDEGTKALKGQWNKTTGEWELINIDGSPPDSSIPSHFIRIYDFFGNPMRVILDGTGRPATDISGTGTTGVAGHIDIEYYAQTDFFAQIDDLPTDLECVA